MDEVDDNDIIRVSGCGGGKGEGVQGSEVVEGKRSEVATIE